MSKRTVEQVVTTMRQFLERQKRVLARISGAAEYKRGYADALDSVETVITTITASKLET